MNITTRTGRRLAATIVGCCAILLPGAALAAPSAPASPSTPARPAAHAITPACETPGLVIWLDTNGDAGAGSVFYKLKFTNLSGHSCTLNGFPFINAVSLTGSLLGHRAAFTGGPGNQITLGQGQTATAALQIVNVLNIPASQCKPVTAAGFRVFPPNQTRAKVVPFPFGACSASGPVFMFVRPVTK
jgi:Protein of unknown function (DUF4232)